MGRGCKLINSSSKFSVPSQLFPGQASGNSINPTTYLRDIPSHGALGRSFFRAFALQFTLSNLLMKGSLSPPAVEMSCLDLHCCVLVSLLASVQGRKLIVGQRRKHEAALAAERKKLLGNEHPGADVCAKVRTRSIHSNDFETIWIEPSLFQLISNW